MRNKFTLLIGFLSFATTAQIINIPDPALKTLLLNYNDGQGFILDANGDGEVQVSEALATTILSVTGLDIADPTGLEAFVNLEDFNCNETSIVSIDLSPFTHLKNTNTGNNALLTSVNLSGLTQLEHLELELNALSTVDLSTLANVNFLDLSYNQLTSLDLTGMSSLKIFTCGYNQINSITLPLPNQIELASLGGNPFTTLDLTRLHVTTLEIYDCPDLVYVNIKNDYFDGLPIIGDLFPNCPNLHYVCADEDEAAELHDALAAQSIEVNSYCTFIPAGNYNTISGKLTFDLDNNGCDAGDVHYPDMKINLNDGSVSGDTFTSADGNYQFYTAGGSFTVAPIFENPYFTVSTAATVEFPVPDSLTETRDFCITANGIHPDLEMSFFPWSAIRPGFDAYFELDFKNKGNQLQSGTVNFTFDDSVLDFVSATPMPSSQSVNTISWDFSDLKPFEERKIDLVLNANSPTEIPPLNINDQLSFTAAVNPVADDDTPLDNVSGLSQTVVGSFDPNDKTCLEGTTMTPQMVGDYLHYVIHFQNSGTAPAENVVVKDIIDTTKFDISTLQLTSSSHPNVTRITDNKVEFIFEGINLPAEHDNEPASHGFVAFKIKTKSNLVLDDSVSNTADIFFDYNFPITTNTASTTVSLLGVNQYEDTSISIAPNPVKNILSVSAKDAITSIQLFDVQGRLIETKTENNTISSLDFSGQTSGVYFVKIYTGKGTKVQKVIKE